MSILEKGYMWVIGFFIGVNISSIIISFVLDEPFPKTLIFMTGTAIGLVVGWITAEVVKKYFTGDDNG